MTPSLSVLEAAIRAAWSPHTSNDLGWSRENPAAGQCAVTALVLQDHLGGTLMRNEINGHSNYFLRLDNGKEIDWAREQFGVITSVTDAEARARGDVLARPDTRRRYGILASAVAAETSRLAALGMRGAVPVGERYGEGWSGMMPELTPLRVGVTGSRTYGDTRTIREALVGACHRSRPHEGHILIHGQCDPQHPDTGQRIPWRRAKKLSIEVQGRLAGADWLCEWVALDLTWGGMPWDVRGHPAGWYPGGRYDRTAGFRRNGQMVEAGADEWEAFLAPCVKPGCRQPHPHPSHGASHCADLAWKAGIPVYRFTDVTLATT